MFKLMCSFLAISFGCLSSRAHFLWFPLDVSATVLTYCDFLWMSQLTCSFLMISFECLSSRAPFLWFPLDVSAHVPISYDFLWMSEPTCSFLVISFGCLSPRDPWEFLCMSQPMCPLPPPSPLALPARHLAPHCPPSLTPPPHPVWQRSPKTKKNKKNKKNLFQHTTGGGQYAVVSWNKVFGVFLSFLVFLVFCFVAFANFSARAYLVVIQGQSPAYYY